jgi:hypothetical protein
MENDHNWRLRRSPGIIAPQVMNYSRNLEMPWTGLKSKLLYQIFSPRGATVAAGREMYELHMIMTCLHIPQKYQGKHKISFFGALTFEVIFLDLVVKVLVAYVEQLGRSGDISLRPFKCLAY